MEEVEAEGEATGPVKEKGMEEAVRVAEGSEEEDRATEAQAEVAPEEVLGWGETGRAAAADWGWAVDRGWAMVAAEEEAAQAEAGSAAGGSELAAAAAVALVAAAAGLGLAAADW